MGANRAADKATMVSFTLLHFLSLVKSLCHGSFSAETEMSSVPSASFLFSALLRFDIKRRDKGRRSRLVLLPTGSIRDLCKNRRRQPKAASSALQDVSVKAMQLFISERTPAFLCLGNNPVSIFHRQSSPQDVFWEKFSGKNTQSVRLADIVSLIPTLSTDEV